MCRNSDKAYTPYDFFALRFFQKNSVGKILWKNFAEIYQAVKQSL